MTRIDTPRNDRAPRARRPGRRGIAMMLVLVALLVTTVLVGAAITSRDNATAIGANAASGAEASWSAESGANFAIGAIAQAPDLAALLGGDDTLSSNMTVGNANVTVRVTNLDGQPPQDADRELIVTATATANGMDKSVEKRLTRLVGGEAPDAADPYLAEFAVFATGMVDVQSGATIGLWPLSPEEGSSLGRPKVGVGFTNASDCNLDPDANLKGVALYADTSASLALETLLEDNADDGYWRIPIDVPTKGGSVPTAITTLPAIGTDVAPAASTTVTVGAGGKYTDLDAGNSSTVILDAAISPRYQFQSILIQNASLVIRGAVEVYVEQSFDVDAGFVVLEDDTSSATFYIGKNLKFTNNAKVGISPPDVDTPATVVSAYVSPARCRFIALAPTHGGDADPHWDFHGQSATVGFIHNPFGRIHLQSSGSVYGHAVAREFWCHSGSSFLYCPTLDSHIGFSSRSCPFFDSESNPIAELITILDNAVAATNSAEGFVNKFRFDYEAAKSDGSLDAVGIVGGTKKTIAETLDISGESLY